MKFVTLHQMLTRLQSRGQKLKFLKFKMLAAAILKIAFFWQLLINRLSDFSEILYEEAEWHVDKGHMTKTADFKNPRWRTAAILKIVISPYLSKKSSDFNEIWYTTLDIEPDYGHVTNNSNF